MREINDHVYTLKIFLKPSLENKYLKYLLFHKQIKYSMSYK